MLGWFSKKDQIKKGVPEAIAEMAIPIPNLCRLVGTFLGVKPFLIQSSYSRPIYHMYQYSSVESPVAVARKLYDTGVRSVLPNRLIRDNVQFEQGTMTIGGKEVVDFQKFENRFVIGFGKAVLPMAEELLSVIGDSELKSCELSVPFGTREPKNEKIKLYRGARNNMVDPDAWAAAKKLTEVITTCEPSDLLIVLISGGGSSLLPYPAPPITLEEKLDLVKNLSMAGATINELNTVRKSISLLKGGGLVKICNAGRIITLILSDVIDNDLQVIASGATVPNDQPASLARSIISKLLPDYEFPPSIRKVLWTQPTPPEPSELAKFKKVSNFIIGSNQVALEAAAKEAQSLNLRPVILSASLCGEARMIGTQLAQAVRCLFRLLHLQDKSKFRTSDDCGKLSRLLFAMGIDPSKTKGCLDLVENGIDEKGICLLFGGETTVIVRGDGVGGRNQEMALASALKIGDTEAIEEMDGKVAILCAGTDGIDGPCNAAGAVVDTTTIITSKREEVDAVAILKENNSYNFFKRVAGGRYHIVTGHSGTNVMDLVIVPIFK